MCKVENIKIGANFNLVSDDEAKLLQTPSGKLVQLISRFELLKNNFAIFPLEML